MAVCLDVLVDLDELDVGAVVDEPTSEAELVDE
jgi:hypothetical protein